MKRALFAVLVFLTLGAVVAATGISVPTLDEFNALEQRVAALEEEVFASPSTSPAPSPSPSESPSPTPAPSEFDRVLTGSFAGLTVPAGEAWKIEGLVESSENVVVRGRLVMRPGSTLRFVGVNEAAFVGGGMDPVASDVGLWVMGDGVLDVQGTPKVPWNRTGTDPSWSATDELVVTPTAAGEWKPEHFRPFTMGSPVPSAFGFSAEVLNLARDVVIEGTPTGRSHVFIRSTQPQTIRYATLRWLGPRKNGEKILGRWPLHFHLMGDASRGSLVEGVVCRNAGSHCFVSHASDGVTFRGDVAFDVAESPFWWDNDVPGDASHDITWESNVAAIVRDAGATDHRNTAFNMDSRGFGNVARGNVATGVLGGADTSGFGWPGRGSGSWAFVDNLAHNSKGNGIFVWQNRGADVISGFVAYRNGQYGIDHGAYTNSFQYRDVVLRGNAWGALKLHALSRSDVQMTFDRVSFGGHVVSVGHNLPGGLPVLFRDCTNLTGVVVDDGTAEGSLLDFVRCGLEPANFQIVHLEPGARIRVQRADGTAFQITPAGVSTIPAFA